MRTRPPDSARRRLVAAGVALLVAPAAAAPFDLAALAALLARQRSGQARFTEERFVTGIDGPLRASGWLRFEAPDRFERRTVEPLAETLAVQGDAVTLQRGGRTRQMTLDAVPEVAMLVAALRGTVNGDVALLQRHFDVKVDGSAARWTLVLKPRDAQLATSLRELQLAGQGGELRSVAIWLAGGDRSLMLIEPLQPLPPDPPRR